jgi:hypothetical protein
MPVPNVYRGIGEGSIASYNFTDIAAGTGMINFYGGKASTSYVLSNFTFFSQPIYEPVVNTTGDFTELFDIDFDVLINKGLTTKGLAIVNVPIRVWSATGAVSSYFIAKIRKWDGVSVETEIANGTSGTWTISPASNYPQNQLTAMINVPQTQFKKGDYLRLTIGVWGKATATSTLTFGHDPKGRFDAVWWSGEDYATEPILNFQLPVRIDL